MDPTYAPVLGQIQPCQSEPWIPYGHCDWFRGGPVTQSQPTKFHPGTFAYSDRENDSFSFLLDKHLREWELGTPRYHQMRTYLIIRQMQMNRQKVEKDSLLLMLFAYLAPNVPKTKLFLDFSGIWINLFFKNASFPSLFPFFPHISFSTYSILYFCVSQPDLGFCHMQSKFPN